MLKREGAAHLPWSLKTGACPLLGWLSKTLQETKTWTRKTKKWVPAHDPGERAWGAGAEGGVEEVLSLCYPGASILLKIVSPVGLSSRTPNLMILRKINQVTSFSSLLLCHT